MPDKAYHHGDLRNALIEAGIAYINENGMSGFSLRKAAAQCGVSHTAPYSHFRDKNDLLEAMKNHVSDRFAEELAAAAQAHRGCAAEEVTAIGTAYVRFFCENPQYYPFVFARSGFDIDLDKIHMPSEYKPFEVFRRGAVKLFEKMRMPEAAWQKTLIKMWSQVHGIAGISVMQGIRFSEDWADMTAAILKNMPAVPVKTKERETV